jgi:hypothetical protein
MDNGQCIMDNGQCIMDNGQLSIADMLKVLRKEQTIVKFPLSIVN